MPFSASSVQGDYSSLERPSRCIRATGAKGYSDKHVSQAVSGIVVGASICCCKVGLNSTPTGGLCASEEQQGEDCYLVISQGMHGVPNLAMQGLAARNR
jgi:hypothetical protein